MYSTSVVLGFAISPTFDTLHRYCQLFVMAISPRSLTTCSVLLALYAVPGYRKGLVQDVSSPA